MKSTIRNHNGMAVLLAVTITVVLVAVSIETHRSARSAALAAALARDQIQLVQTAASGVHLAMAVLIRDKQRSQVDSLLEDWADPIKLQRQVGQLEFENTRLSLKISDEKGKIQVNALVATPGGQSFNEIQRQLWERFLLRWMDLRETRQPVEIDTVINAAKDWFDSGDDDAVTGLGGAESSYYQTLTPPYGCRNGPARSLAELQMIRGVDAALFQGQGDLPGFQSITTIYGATVTGAGERRYPGTININTAPLPVLEAMLPREHRDLADAIADYRDAVIESDRGEDFSRPTWYQNAPGCGEVVIAPQLITTASDIFRIESTAASQTLTLSVIAVVERVKEKKDGTWKCRILNWQLV